MKTRAAGYSIAEMLVVIAIVGLMTLAAVPAFMTFRNANKMRTSVTTFTTDLRGARQRAITSSHQVLMTYALTATGAVPANYQRTYYFFDGNLPANSTTWTPVNRTVSGTGGTTAALHQLDDVIYFPANSGTTPQTFTDTLTCSLGSCSSGTDNRPDVIFFPDGHVLLPNGATSATITLMTDSKIPKNQYTITISPSGRVQAQ